MRVILDRILVLPDAPDSKVGNLVIPDAVQEKASKGVIVQVGDGTSTEPMRAKEGDRILFRKGAGVEITFDKTYLVISQKDIIIFE